MKILISDSLSKQGVDLLEKAGFTVVVKSKLSKEELFKEIKDADGLIVRSGTKVTAICAFSTASWQVVNLLPAMPFRSPTLPDWQLSIS